MARQVAKKRMKEMEGLKDSLRDPRIRGAMTRICAKVGVRDPYELALKHPKVFDEFVSSVAELNEQAPVETAPGFLR